MKCEIIGAYILILLVVYVCFNATKTRLLSNIERNAIVGRHTSDMSTHYIVAFLGMAQSIVFTIWKNF